MARLVVSRDTDPGRVRQLFRAGADDALVLPRDLAGLPAALRDAVRRRDETRGAEARTGQVIAVWSPKGGTGCSLLAANLAVALQAREGRRTLLADLCGPYGGVGLLLGLQPERTFADLYRVIGELSGDHLAQACTAHDSGLSVLCASARPEALGGLLPEHVEAVASLAARLFTRTVLDVPSAWHPATGAALGAADRILAVVTPDAPAVRTLQAALPLLPARRREQKMVGLVVTRLSGRSELRAEEIGRALELPLLGTVRADFPALEPLINTAQPLLGSTPGRRQQSRVGADVLRLARLLA